MNKIELQEQVNNAIIISSIHQARVEFGLDFEDLNALCQQVSDAITEYNRIYAAEMLFKTPEIIFEQLDKGLSCLIAANTNNGWKFLHHGSMYPLLVNGEERLTGIQVVEFGSAITHPDYRGEYGLGTRGVVTRIEMMTGMETERLKVLGIATIKRLATGHMWHKLNVSAVSFWEHPYTSFLTNTCLNSSERFGHESCRYRRTKEESDPRALKELFAVIKCNNLIPCTLVATNGELIKIFEQRCTSLHMKLDGESLKRGEISVNSYKKADWFFSKLAELASQNGY